MGGAHESAAGRGTATRRRGRPPDTDSADTRQTIFDAARRLFAERGYGAVTNKEVASAAGITTGALYHYVESKLDLYVEVHRDMQRTIYQQFQDAVNSADTFLGKLMAVLDAAYDIGERDPTMAGFIGAVRADTRRHADIAARLERHAVAREQFFFDIVDIGVVTGEIEPENRPLAVEFVRTLLVGLTESTLEAPSRNRDAIDGVKALLRGTLIIPVPQRR